MTSLIVTLPSGLLASIQQETVRYSRVTVVSLTDVEQVLLSGVVSFPRRDLLHFLHTEVLT
jgi:hypothetical protein